MKNKKQYDFSKIDVELLKKQKRTLHALGASGVISKETVNNLDGIIEFLDSIQDHLVDGLGLDEEKVFDLEHEGLPPSKHPFNLEVKSIQKFAKKRYTGK